MASAKSSEEKAREGARRFLAMLKTRGADNAVVSLSSQKTSQIKFSNSVINASMLYYDYSMSVFASFNKRIVSTVLKSFEPKTLEKSADFISKFARSVEPNPEYMGIAKGPFRYKKIEGLYDKALENIGEKSMDYVSDSISEASAGRVKRTAGILETESSSDYLITSGNVEAEERSTGAYFSIRAIVEKDESAHSVTVSKTLSGFNPVRCAGEASEIAGRVLPKSAIVPGKYDVLFYPLPFAALLDLAASSCSIFEVESGFSFFQNMLGKKAASPIVNLYDDPSMPFGFGSSTFDDEGVPTQKNVLIENGILKTYLHNTSTAKRHHTKTTASAGLVAPEPSNIALGKGGYSIEELIGEIKKGIIVTNLWYTRFQNYKTGDFSTIPRDRIFVVENGRIKSCTSGIRIADSMPNIMKSIGAIGKEDRQILGWEVEVPVKTAPVLVKNVNITRPLK
ncbi:MAG: TldD/PmbA family protein [Candidatus Woesearchaeota archaeon]|nr:TldD/PmbA family protein [Candidatus Woesearchaeota archaeon]